METWKIELTAQNEEQAVKYLQKLVDTMKIAAEHNLPMRGMFIESNGEKIICERIKK